MILTNAVAAGVRDGSVSVAYRRWARARVSAGDTFRSVAGVIRVVDIREVESSSITPEDARAAGAASADEVRRGGERR